MLEAYFDESGDPSDPKVKVFTLSWLVASEKDWKIFTGKWGRILRRYKVSMMHIKDFEHSTGEFRGWDRARKDSFAAQLAGILKNTFHLGHSHSMSVDVWQKIVSPRMETPYKKKRGPYIFLLQSCLESLVEYGEGLPTRERVACVFDENNLVRFAAEGHYADLMKARNWNRLHEEVTYKNKRDRVPLQAADMLAYEGYKDIVNMMEGSTRPRRKLLGNLMKSNRVKLAVVDVEGFWKDVERNLTPCVRS